MLDNPMIRWQDDQNESKPSTFNSAEYADFLYDMYADDLSGWCTEENLCEKCLGFEKVKRNDC